MEKAEIKKLAEKFCAMNARDQARFLNEVAWIFRSWGDVNEACQADAIATNGTLNVGKEWIDLVYGFIRR